MDLNVDQLPGQKTLDLVNGVLTVERLSEMAEEQVLQLVNDILQKADMTDIRRCWECEKLDTDYIENCESYKDYKETLCRKCAQYCEECAEYYCSAGDYKHECCKESSDSSEDNNDEESSESSEESSDSSTTCCEHCTRCCHHCTTSGIKLYHCKHCCKDYCSDCDEEHDWCEENSGPVDHDCGDE